MHSRCTAITIIFQKVSISRSYLNWLVLPTFVKIQQVVEKVIKLTKLKLAFTGMLLRFFVHFYDMEIIEEEAFLAWKEDITQEFPGKGKALFQVNLTLETQCLLFLLH